MNATAATSYTYTISKETHAVTMTQVLLYPENLVYAVAGKRPVLPQKTWPGKGRESWRR